MPERHTRSDTRDNEPASTRHPPSAGDPARITAAPPGHHPTIVDPWATWGWLFGGVWLLFFIFPLFFIWTGAIRTPSRLLATALIVAFMVLYSVTLRRCISAVSTSDFSHTQRIGWAGLVLLVGLAVVLGILIGPNSMTAWPFIVGLPVFFLPWRWIWATSLTLLIGVIVGSSAAWGWWPPAMFWGFSVLVLGISVVSRYMDERQESNRETMSRLELTEERERVARDVHDVLGHSLTVVTIKTELARRLVDVDPERAKTELAEVQDLARSALAEILQHPFTGLQRHFGHDPAHRLHQVEVRVVEGDPGVILHQSGGQ